MVTKTRAASGKLGEHFLSLLRAKMPEAGRNENTLANAFLRENCRVMFLAGIEWFDSGWLLELWRPELLR